jgi:hypothetical protein
MLSTTIVAKLILLTIKKYTLRLNTLPLNLYVIYFLFFI